MSSVHKQAGRKYLYCAYVDGDGVRRFKSTKVTDRATAEEICRSWDKASKFAGKGKLTPSIAREIISQGVADVFLVANKEPLPSSSVSAFAKSWQDSKQLELEETSFKRYQGIIARFVGFLGPRADKDLELVTARDVLSFRDDLARNLSPASAQTALKVLRAFLGAAHRQGLITQNVASFVPKLKERGESKRRPLTIAEIKKVLQATKDTEMEGLILFGIYTGQRLGDLARLTWRQIDLQSKQVSFVTGKTGRRMQLPLMKPLLKYLEKLASSDDPDAPVFPKSFDVAEKSVNISMLSRQFYNALVDSGLATKRKHRRLGKERKLNRDTSEISFHSLRHSATSFLKAAGVSDALAREIIGHETEAINRQYTHLGVEDLRKAMKNLPDFTKQK